MMQKKLNMIFNFAFLFALVSIIAANQPFPTDFVVVIRETSYYLSLSLIVIFISHSYYIKLKTKNHSTKTSFFEVAWRPVLLVLFIGSFLWIQNKTYEENQFMPFDCTYMDHSGNVIYESVLKLTCEKPTVVSYDEHHIVLVFNETRNGEFNYRMFDGVQIDREEPIITSIEIQTEISISYDLDMHMIFYQADMITSTIFLHENEYYHTYTNERFQVSQVYNETSMISTQTFLASPILYRIEDEKRLNLPEFDTESLVEENRVIYDMQVNILNNEYLFTIERSQFPANSAESVKSNVSGIGMYNQNGFIVDIRIQESYMFPDRIAYVFRDQNQYKIIRELDPSIKKEIQYNAFDGSYRMQSKKTIYNNSNYNQKFKYYQRNSMEGILASSRQSNTHYHMIEEVYGTQITRFVRKSIDLSYFNYFNYLMYFRTFDYYNMLGYNYDDLIYVMNHPIIEYMESNIPDE